VFTRTLQDETFAQAVVVGGTHGTPQQVASFGGGQVWDYGPAVRGLTASFTAIRDVAGIAVSSAVPEGFPGLLPLEGQEFSFVPQELADIDRLPSGGLKYPG